MKVRRQIVDRLLAAHEAWFNVERDYAFAGRLFPGYAEFHSSASQYVLVKRAKLWEAKTNEYLFFWDTAHLAVADFLDLVQFMKTDAVAKVVLEPDHMSSYLSLVVIADKVDGGVERCVRAARFRKSFAFGLKGWADMRVAVVDLGRGRVYVNAQGKPLRETLAANAFGCAALATCEGGCGSDAPGASPSSSASSEGAPEAFAARASSRI